MDVLLSQYHGGYEEGRRWLTVPLLVVVRMAGKMKTRNSGDKAGTAPAAMVHNTELMDVMEADFAKMKEAQKQQEGTG